MTYKRKLVEVSLPLEAISAASRRDKDRSDGTIKNVHKWFAPMPTPAWRALLFASLVDDPGEGDERARLLDLIVRLVPEHGGAPDSATLAEARRLLVKSTGGSPPTVFDPFCGGGSTLVEAQRLGLPAAGSDLNPVPVLITRLLTELVPRVMGRPPLVGDAAQLGKMSGGPLDGFLSDCRNYAQRIRDKVSSEIGHLYPSAPNGQTIVAWLWARTVVCPNPACQAIAPLITSFWLSKKKGAETWIEPVDRHPGKPVRFELGRGVGSAPLPTKSGRGGTFRCVVCEGTIPEPHVKAEGMAGRLDTQLMAVSYDGPNGRDYLAGSPELEPPTVERPVDVAQVELPSDTRAFWSQLYGEKTFADQFSDRQLVALTAFADAVTEAPRWVQEDGGDPTYVKAVASVLGLCVGKLAATHSRQCRWYVRNGPSRTMPAFSRQALPMVWDFAEANPFGGSVGDWIRQVESVVGGLRALPTDATPARTFQADARTATGQLDGPLLIATDPPYFAHIGYADLSDYFYLWLRPALNSVHSDLFATVATPKSEELIAAPHRHGGNKEAATEHFVDGFTEAFDALGKVSAPDLPFLVVYAHRQEDTNGDKLSSTAWDAMLTAVLDAGLRIVGTWPIHATRSTRQIGLGTNALASYVVLVCRPSEMSAPFATRKDLVSALRAQLPTALRHLQQGNIAPVDLAQAAIGPGMAVFSSYSRVIEADGSQMGVRSALELINQVLDETLSEQEGEFDRDTRWAVAWFEQYGIGQAQYGIAETLARAKNTAIDAIVEAGILEARAGKVRLLKRHEMPADWDPEHDARTVVWEVTQHLIRRLENSGEPGAATLLKKVGGLGEAAKDLAYRLYSICEHKGWVDEALAYNSLVVAWPHIARLAGHTEQAVLNI